MSFSNAPSQAKTLKINCEISDYFESTNMVKLYVGPNKRLFNLHEEILCDRAAYFRAAFKGHFKEGEEKVLNLPEENPATFKHLINWIYGQGLTLGKFADSPIADPDSFLKLCQIYVMADKFYIDDLAKSALDHFKGRMNWNHIRWIPRTKEVLYVYQNTLDSSPLRSLIVTETIRHYLNPSFIVADWESIKTCESTFSKDVTEAMRAHVLIPVSGTSDDDEYNNLVGSGHDWENENECTFAQCILHGRFRDDETWI